VKFGVSCAETWLLLPESYLLFVNWFKMESKAVLTLDCQYIKSKLELKTKLIYILVVV
jgi:hypothetical protein